MSVAVATAGVGVTLLTIVECVQSTLCAATVPTLCRRCLALVPSFAGCACEVSMLCVAFRGRDIDFSTTHGCCLTCWCSANDIGDSGMGRLAGALHYMQHLEFLGLGGTVCIVCAKLHAGVDGVWPVLVCACRQPHGWPWGYGTGTQHRQARTSDMPGHQ